MPLLTDLAAALPNADHHHTTGVKIREITCDSRQVEPGDLFVAVPGVSVDGHDYIPQALSAGAAAVVAERRLPALEGVPTILVPNAREAEAYLHAALRGFPATKVRMVGVTGTEGKTTTVRLLSRIFEAAGETVGSIDTVAAIIAGRETATGAHTTTPDAPDMQRLLDKMVSEGVTTAVIEATSHGLAMHRVTACAFDAAVVTNVTHDHLNYHGSWQAYLDAKAMLFEGLATSPHKTGIPKVAITNADDASFERLRTVQADIHMSYGLDHVADVTAEGIQSTESGLHLVTKGPGGRRVQLQSPLVGTFNVYNILAAVALAWAWDLNDEAIQEGVASFHGAIGRMERIMRGQPFEVYIDFAHTPNALQRALTSLRETTRGKLWVVFGCAGLRDRAKRPLMGRIAAEIADSVVLTAEDPRTESVEAIIEEIARGAEEVGYEEGAGYWRIPDRAQAIAFALGQAAVGDTVVVTGKGHEPTMCYGTTEHPWSDHAAVDEALADLGYG
ncbi:MAG: UDP-N-acetylmuramoyl-L-alanyl-D-glutamate--2,6-diaminopimelate ligase [Anaerolineae bacterium]